MTWKEEERLREIMASVDSDIRAPTDLKARVMERVMAEQGGRSRVGRLVDSLFTPRTFTLTPAHGLGLVAAAMAAILVWPGGSGTTTESGKDGHGRATHFVLVAPDVGSVHLTGDFTSWSQEGIPLRDVNGSGTWVADVELDPGVYQYVFIVDGEEWRADPGAAAQVDDGFGQVNSVVMVSDEEESSAEGRT